MRRIYQHFLSAINWSETPWSVRKCWGFSAPTEGLRPAPPERAATIKQTAGSGDAGTSSHRHLGTFRCSTVSSMGPGVSGVSQRVGNGWDDWHERSIEVATQQETDVPDSIWKIVMV